MWLFGSIFESLTKVKDTEFAQMQERFNGFNILRSLYASGCNPRKWSIRPLPTLTVYDPVGQIWGGKDGGRTGELPGSGEQTSRGAASSAVLHRAVTLFSSAIKPNPQTVLSCPGGTDQKYIYQIDLFSHIFNELTVSYPELKYGFGDTISFATQPTLCIWMMNGWSTGW